MKNDLTQEFLKSILEYNPETGEFTRLDAYSNNVKVGDVAGSRNTRGYIVIRIKQRDYLAHRLAWLYMTGGWPVKNIDHKDGCCFNNKWSNLREATQSENLCNKRIQSNNTSGIKGVSRTSCKRKWRASIQINKRPKHLGIFNTKHEAEKAYKEAASQLHGEFARY